MLRLTLCYLAFVLRLKDSVQYAPATWRGCPDGWWTSDDVAGCYWLSADLKRYWEAFHACADKGGTLAAPRTEAENWFLENYVIRYNTDITWLGLRYETDHQGWEIGRIPVYYSNWGPTDPETPPGQWYRGALTTDHGGHWIYDEGDNLPDCIYQILKGEGDCASGWETEAGLRHCYTVLPCGMREALASIFNQQTDTFLFELIARRGYRRARIGLHKTGPKWLWMSVPVEYLPPEISSPPQGHGECMRLTLGQEGVRPGGQEGEVAWVQDWCAYRRAFYICQSNTKQ